jgi:AcrR family transcriptional regulator
LTGPSTEPVARRPGRPRNEAIDEAILDATIDELIERGYLGMTMESIAARAGVAKTTVYRRWSSNDELAIQAMQRIHGPASVQTAGMGARQRLLCLLDAMRRTWTDPRYAALMRRVAADGTAQPEAYRDFRDRLVGPHIEAMNRALRAAIEEGLIRDDIDVNWVRQMLSSPVLAAALTLKARVTRAQVEFTLDTVLAGLSS